MRRRPTPAERELRAIIQRMTAESGKTYGIASQVKGEYAGITRYRHCLYEIVEGVTYKRTAWASSHAALLEIIHRRAEKHTTKAQGAA